MPAASPDVSYDAVIIVPGIMGSALRLAATGESLWGFPSVVQYVRFWASDGLARKLRVTDEERAGVTGRVVPDGLLRFPAAAPILQGVEPYDQLVAEIRGVMADPAAVLEFAYDWRLAVEHNARELARAAAAHLRQWRDHPALDDAPVKQHPRLVIVAHSMGGLLARALPLVEGSGDVPAVTAEIRAVVTLGTPFLGAVKAAVLVNSGAGTPVPFAHKARMRMLAASCPGVHDLLPMYRCVERDGDVTRLTAEDVAAIGGSRSMAQAAIDFDRKAQLLTPVGHHLLYGTQQPTSQSMKIVEGDVVASPEHFEWDGDGPARDGDGQVMRRKLDGDGTVGRDWATHGHTSVASALPQQHGALAKSPEAIAAVVAVLLQRQLGGVQGRAELGLDVPDVVRPGEPWRIVVTGESRPAAVRARVVDVATRRHREVRFQRVDDHLEGSTDVDGPGLYRVALSSGGQSPTTQLVLCLADEVQDGG